MVFFDYLTENAYVSTGRIKVEEFYRAGYNTAQRVGYSLGSGEVATGSAKTASSTTPVEALNYTALVGGTYTITYSLSVGATDDGTAVVKVGGTQVATQTLAAGSSDTSYTVTAENVAAGEAIVVTVEAGGATTDVDITAPVVSMLEQPFPETFQREWATFANGRDDVLGYDPGAYGIGTPVYNRSITVPAVKKVTLLYMYDTESTREVRRLVQYDGTASEAIAAGILGSGNSKVIRTNEEYIEKFGYDGFNRFGRVLPPDVQDSTVQELSSFKGTFVDTDGNTQNNVVLYVDPVYMNNGLPMFDMVYMLGGFSGNLDGDESLISGRLLRWHGEYVSENVAPINRAGDEYTNAGYWYYVDGSGNTIQLTTDDVVTSQDGIAYTNADAYNLRNYRRY